LTCGWQNNGVDYCTADDSVLVET